MIKEEMRQGLMGCLICLGLWILVASGVLEQYMMYRYPHIFDGWEFFSQTVVNLLLPLIPMVFALVFSCLGKDGLKWVCYVLFGFMLVVMFIRGGGEMLFKPTMCSYTKDIEKFGRYDQETIGDAEYFPDMIPEDAEECRVYYVTKRDYLPFPENGEKVFEITPV